MFLSIIVPVFNTDVKYLDKCIKSIVDNNLDSFEVIVINDCSTNKNTLDYLSKIKNNKVRIIHNKKNIGLGPARNVGISSSKGKYIMFVDSDDFIEKDAISLNFIRNNNADIISFNFNYYKDDKKIINKKYKWKLNGNFIYGGATAWSKFYRKDFLLENKILFCDQNFIHEDEYFFIKILQANPKIISCDSVIYDYRIDNNNSITKTSDILKSFTHVSSQIDLISFLKTQKEARLYFTRSIFCYPILFILKNKKNVRYKDFKDISKPFIKRRKYIYSNNFIKVLFLYLAMSTITLFVLFYIFKLINIIR